MNMSNIGAKATAVLTSAGLAVFSFSAIAGNDPGGSLIYPVSVPEPSGLALLAGGAATAILLARAKRKK